MKRLLTILFVLGAIATFGQPVGMCMYPASGFSPYTLPNIVGRYDASVSSSVHIGTGVSQWDDLSAAGHNLVQAAASQQPTYSGSVITFDGVNDVLGVGFALSQPQTTYIVVKPIVWSLNKYIIDGGTFTSDVVFQAAATPGIEFFAGSSSAQNSDLTVGSFKVVAVVFNGASSTLSVNDGTKTSSNVGTNAPSGFTIGGGATQVNSFSNIAVEESINFGAAHSSALQTQIIAYLKTKWGIP